MDDEEVDEIFDEIVTDEFDPSHSAEVQKQTKRIRRIWLLHQIAMGAIWAGVATVAIVATLAIVVILTTLTIGLVLSHW